jgi:hypothetical protein
MVRANVPDLRKMTREGFMKSLIAVLMILFLISCGSEPKQPPGRTAALPAPTSAAGPYPEDYELRIISWLRMNSDDPDNVLILSIEPPQPKNLEVSSPDRSLMKGDPVWESMVLVQLKNPPSPPTYRHFYFKDGVIRAVDLK